MVPLTYSWNARMSHDINSSLTMVFTTSNPKELRTKSLMASASASTEASAFCKSICKKLSRTRQGEVSSTCEFSKCGAPRGPANTQGSQTGLLGVVIRDLIGIISRNTHLFEGRQLFRRQYDGHGKVLLQTNESFE